MNAVQSHALTIIHWDAPVEHKISTQKLRTAMITS
jgi:hypothetical protein